MIIEDSFANFAVMEQQQWLLYVVVCNGKGLYIGPEKAEGDIFCMIHAQIQDEPRSRTVNHSIPVILFGDLT